MKKWVIMLLALLAFAALPTSGTELGELHPVSLLMVQTQGKTIQLLTDTQDRGSGETLDGALKNLEDTTPGHLFLDTVEYLILTETAPEACITVCTHFSTVVRKAAELPPTITEI